jgi:hypothetical protein
MEMVAKLVKKYRLVRLCRIGAWIVAIIGLLDLAMVIFNSWQNYQQILIEATRDPYLSANFMLFIPTIFNVVPTYLFYFIVLYAASVVFTAISAQPATASATSQPGSMSELDSTGSEEDPDRIVYTSLKHEDIAWDRRQISNHKSAGHLS